MAEHIFQRAMQAALIAFLRGQMELNICGITLQILHAHDDNYQVLLPESCKLREREIFRIFDHGRDSIIMPV